MTNTRLSIHLEVISNRSPLTVHCHSSSNRLYSLLRASNLAEPNWAEGPGQTYIPGTGGWDALSDTNIAPAKFCKVGVSIPE